jgi:glycosyltransferase involved in cell wall biosynthesis
MAWMGLMNEDLRRNVQGPLVSVIIPSFNSMTGTKNIAGTLKSIRNQTYSTIETLVIDNFSEDSTIKVCADYPVRLFRIKGGRSKARNFGITKMHGDYALFVDSDHILMPKLVEECVYKAVRLKVDCIMVPVLFISNTKTRLNCSEMRNLELKSGLGTQSLILFYAASLIRNIEFPESVELGEDIVFSSRALKYRLKVSIVKSNIYHIEDGTAKNLILRSWNYGKKFNLTVSNIGPRDSTRLILGLSVVNLSKLRKIIPNVSKHPTTLFSFIVYVLLKHLSFAASYCLSFLNRVGDSLTPEKANV